MVLPLYDSNAMIAPIITHLISLCFRSCLLITMATKLEYIYKNATMLIDLLRLITMAVE